MWVQWPNVFCLPSGLWSWLDHVMYGFDLTWKVFVCVDVMVGHSSCIS